MLNFLNKYRKDIKYSQNGEESIIQECVYRLSHAGDNDLRAKLKSGVAVEIGGHDGRWCSNIALLLECGWSGTFVETDFHLWEQCRDNWAHNPMVKCICSHVDKYNVNAFVKDDCDLLSLDTDGDDYQIFEGLRSKPKIVIIEIDSSIPPDVKGFNQDGGASYRTAVELGIEKGYFLLCHTGNLILIDKQYRKLFPEIKRDGLKNAERYFNRAWIKKAA